MSQPNHDKNAESEDSGRKIQVICNAELYERLSKMAARQHLPLEEYALELLNLASASELVSGKRQGR